MLIQTPRLSRKLQRALRLTSLPDSVLAPETVSVIVVEDLSAPLSDEDRGCMGSVAPGATAAEFPLALLVRVGAPAQYDLVVTAVNITTLQTQSVAIVIPTVAVVGLSASTNKSFTDLGIPGLPSSQVASDTQAAIPANRVIWQALMQADEPIRVPLKVRIGTIGDGNNLTSIMVNGQTVNTQIIVSWEWTESAPQG